jgi:hypothetical protein
MIDWNREAKRLLRAELVRRRRDRRCRNPNQFWVRHGLSDEGPESATPHLIRQDYGDDASGHERTDSEPKPASVVILSADEDFLFKAIVKELMWD